MKPQMQTILSGVEGNGFEPGNCLAACIASLLELPISDVPNFVARGEHWSSVLQEWLAPRGLRYLSVHLGAAESMVCSGFQDVYHIMSGPGPRGRMHSVVGYSGGMVHDPHPSGEGLKDCHWFGFLVPADPARFHL